MPVYSHGFGVTIDDVNAAVLAAQQNVVMNSQRGVANGVATLDVNGKVPVAQLPEAVVGALKFQGTYNAATNTPALPTASTANLGWYYVVATAGNGHGVGDWVLNASGSAWVRLDAQDAVSSVAGKTGAVTLDTSDISGLSTALAGKANTSHNHSASEITTGTMATARLGSGTANNTTFLRGDGAWATISAGSEIIGKRVMNQRAILGTNHITDRITELDLNLNAGKKYHVSYRLAVNSSVFNTQPFIIWAGIVSGLAGAYGATQWSCVQSGNTGAGVLTNINPSAQVITFGVSNSGGIIIVDVNGYVEGIGSNGVFGLSLTPYNGASITVFGVSTSSAVEYV